MRRGVMLVVVARTIDSGQVRPRPTATSKHTKRRQYYIDAIYHTSDRHELLQHGQNRKEQAKQGQFPAWLTN